MQRVLLGLLALLSCALAAPVAPATAAAPLKPVAKAKGGGRSDMMKGLAATLSPDNKKAFKALVAEKKLAKGEAAIPRAHSERSARHSPLATSPPDHLAATLPSPHALFPPPARRTDAPPPPRGHRRREEDGGRRGQDQDAPGRLVRQLRGRQGGEEGRREGRRRRAEAAAAAEGVSGDPDVYERAR